MANIADLQSNDRDAPDMSDKTHPGMAGDPVLTPAWMPASAPAGAPTFDPAALAALRPREDAATLRGWLDQTAQATLDWARSLAPSDLTVPCLAILNPPLWELGHIAWFQELWVLRRGHRARPTCLDRADALYDSSVVAHDTRWHLRLPDLGATLAYIERVLDASRAELERAAREGLDDALAYFTALAIFHQDMHNEALCYTWHTLGRPRPGALLPQAGDEIDTIAASPVPAGDLYFAAQRRDFGARPGEGFRFDNEKWAHSIDVGAFAIARHPVDNAAFRAFVEDDGYARRPFWTDADWAWLQRAEGDGRGTAPRRHPRDWRREGDAWLQRRFDRWLPLDDGAPVTHISLAEARAYCAWAGRRLPTEFEWETMATCAEAGRDWQASGRWEWTASVFAPYPGFSPDPYRDYSAPWFGGTHAVLRGASFATPPRLRRSGMRNFYTPDRADVFCGLRTCAADFR